MVFVSDFKFYIDKFEVTNQDYQECVAAGACKDNKKYNAFTGSNQPVVGVNQNDARTYCQWAGKRLPKEQEWQEAAQGTDGRIYPWGNDSPNCNLANYGDCKIGQTLAVGSKPAGASPYGALDMAGNVWEWVEEKGVVRGGGWDYNPTTLRVSNRARSYAAYRGTDYGFRCARDGS
jgi:serine/threonine-protein kinase